MSNKSNIELKLEGFFLDSWEGHIRYLKSIITGDEKELDAVKCRYKDSNGILVLTTKRLLFIYKSFFKFRIEDFGLSKISTIKYDKKIISIKGSIVLESPGKTIYIYNISVNQIEDFAQLIRSKLDNYQY